MILRKGNKGEDVKSLQRGLNKLGQLLRVDGDFGLATCDAVEAVRPELGIAGPSTEAEDALQNALANIPDPFPALTAAGVTFIARAEVTDGRTYRARYQSPEIPPPPSGVTIGIGYDCRFVDAARFRADWQDLLPKAYLEKLEGVLGQEGSVELRESVADVTIPLVAAMKVFTGRSLPEYLLRTAAIYPEVSALSPARRTAMVSLVYNRGTSLSGDRRKEMYAIQQLLGAGRQDEIAEQFEKMTRLWDPNIAAGLIARRRAEAVLWESGFSALMMD
jgi:peptidoglycan hydrolase-like protein with peptidoglycan-binding domain